MAWRPTRFLVAGELRNTKPGKVTGWMRFAGKRGKVTFDLDGDFHRDIRGATIRFTGDGDRDDPEAPAYMKRFAARQAGKVGDMTAGLPPRDYTGYPYLEWYSEENGRVVIELDGCEVLLAEITGSAVPLTVLVLVPALKLHGIHRVRPVPGRALALPGRGLDTSRPDFKDRLIPAVPVPLAVRLGTLVCTFLLHTSPLGFQHALSGMSMKRAALATPLGFLAARCFPSALPCQVFGHPLHELHEVPVLLFP